MKHTSFHMGAVLLQDNMYCKQLLPQSHLSLTCNRVAVRAALASARQQESKRSSKAPLPRAQSLERWFQAGYASPAFFYPSWRNRKPHQHKGLHSWKAGGAGASSSCCCRGGPSGWRGHSADHSQDVAAVPFCHPKTSTGWLLFV